MRIDNIFKSNYCKIVFLLAFLGSSFLIPARVFHTDYAILALFFMFSFALSITCITRNIKERILLAKTYQTSVVGIIASALGLAALQVCGLGMPVCGSTVGFSLVALFFPGVLFPLLKDYAAFFLIIAIGLQLISIYFLKCFKRK